jgi:hypothetical protein
MPYLQAAKAGLRRQGEVDLPHCVCGNVLGGESAYTVVSPGVYAAIEQVSASYSSLFLFLSLPDTTQTLLTAGAMRPGGYAARNYFGVGVPPVAPPLGWLAVLPVVPAPLPLVAPVALPVSPPSFWA